MPNRTPSYIINLSGFLHFLLISRVWASIKKAAKKIRKNEFLAKSHLPRSCKICQITD